MIQLMVYWHDFGPVVIQNMMEREPCGKRGLFISALSSGQEGKQKQKQPNKTKKKKSLNFTMPQFLKVFTIQYVNGLGRRSVSRVLALS